MLALSGLRYQDRGRVALHQLHPLLVHLCLFGAAYRTTTLEAARTARRAG